MKFDEKSRKIPEKSRGRTDRVVIILGLSLLVASCFSYFVVEAFAQSDLPLEVSSDNSTYSHNDTITISGQVANVIPGNVPVTITVVNSMNSIVTIDQINVSDDGAFETTFNASGGLWKYDGTYIIKVNYGSLNDNVIVELIGGVHNLTNSGNGSGGMVTGAAINTDEIILNDKQTTIIGIISFALIGIVGIFIGVRSKKIKLEIFQRRGLTSIQKEQIRNRQYGKCNMCFTSPSQWKYDCFDGYKSNNDLNNYQGLCPDCFSVKTERDNRPSIYQKSK